MPVATVISLLNILSGAVAFLVSYYAYKSNKVLNSHLLRYISIGFLLLGVSLLLEAGTETLVRVTPVDAVKFRGIELVEFLIYTALQLVAYAVFAWGYALSALRNPYGDTLSAAPTGDSSKPAGPAAIFALATKPIVHAAFVLAVYMVSQFGILVLLVVVVYHGVVVFTRTKSNLALMVLFGFLLILLGHVLLFTSALYTSGVLLVVGDSIQFLGFAALALFLYWSGRVVK